MCSLQYEKTAHFGKQNMCSMKSNEFLIGLQIKTENKMWQGVSRSN